MSVNQLVLNWKLFIFDAIPNNTENAVSPIHLMLHTPYFHICVEAVQMDKDLTP